MPRCEMCGTTEDELQKVTVEQATLEVCSGCEKYGATIETETETETETSEEPEVQETETTSESTTTEESMWSENELRSDYGEVLENAREEKGLSLTEAANEMNIKKNHLRKVESGERLPSREMQDKLERFYDISLSGLEGEDMDYEESEEGSVRLGEIAKIN